MKKFLIFIGGFVAGILATILVLFLFYAVENAPIDEGLRGLTIFPEKGGCITTEYETERFDSRSGRLVTTVTNELRIFQVLAPNMALATTGRFGELIVLLINNDGISYFDNQIIQIPADKCARQIGTYQYTSQKGRRRLR